MNEHDRVQADAASLLPPGQFFDAMPIGVALLSARQEDFGHFVRVNRAACRLVGRQEHELLAGNRAQFTFPDDREAGAAELQKLLDGEAEQATIEKRIVRPDGTLVWVQVDYSTIRDGDGEPRYLIGQIQDIGERRRRTQQLRCEGVFRNALMDCVTADGAISAVLPGLAEALDCQLASTWQLDEDSNTLRAASGWRSAGATATAALSREMALEPGAGLPGRAWEQAHAVSSADIAVDPTCPRAAAAAADGLVAAVAFPLVAGNKVVGIVELLSSHPLDLDRRLLDMLDEGGRRMGAYIARQQLEVDSTQQTELLLVEDDPFIASLVEQMLSDSESTLVLRHADSLAAARKQILAEPPACVLLDLTLPDAKGLQGLLAVRKLVPETPIVVLTAHEDADLALRAVQEGAQDYLVKRKADMEALGRSIRYAIERKRSERLANEALLHDRVTGLPNRALLADRVRVALTRRSSRAGFHETGHVVLLHIDLKQFRLINDSLGHETGDAVLMETGKRLRDRTGAGTTVAALGADKFSVLAENVANPQGAVALAERLLEAFATPIVVGTEELNVDASVGIVVANGDLRDADALLHDADIARARAKELGSRYEVFDEHVRVEVRERLKLNTELRSALDDQQFRLHYQPIVSLADGAPTAVEALIRWQHPERGLLSPAEFLVCAEENSLIVPIGEWIVSEACRWLQQAQPGDGKPLSISVNISPVQLRDPDLVDSVRSAIETTGIPPAQLWLEITESALIDESAGPLETLEALKGLGITLVLDDFGTGYSSLSYLRRFPIDVLKVDRSLVTGLDEDTQLREIVTAVLSMGEALGMVVVAEGVESYEDVRRLKDMGCWLAQGYYFARPLPGNEAARLLGRKDTRQKVA